MNALFLPIGDYYPLTEVMFGLTPGVLGIGVLMIGMFVYLVAKKTVNWITPVSMISSLLVIAFIVGLSKDINPFVYSLYQVFGGMFLFVAFFITTDPITTPIDKYGKIVYGVLAGAITMFVRFGSEFGVKPSYTQGVVFAILFLSMLTPMINVQIANYKKKKAAAKKAGA